MLGLAIHTSSPQLGLMLQSADGDNAVKRHQVWNLGREVSSHLHEKMIEFVAPYSWQDLSFVAVAKGPGGFTGTRVGVVAARTLAQQLQVPLFGVSSLAALAASRVLRKHSPSMDRADQDVAIAMDAKRESVFGAIYRPAIYRPAIYRATEQGDWTAVRTDEVVPIAKWAMILTQWERPCAEVKAAAGEGLAESVTGVMEIAIARYQTGNRPDWSSVMPFYGQHPVHR